jgi:hypothetical protein
LDEEHNEREYEHDVDVGAEQMKADPAEKPQHKKNYKDRPEHFCILTKPNSIAEWDVLPTAQVARVCVETEAREAA